MNRKDITASLIIGGAVGLLLQPILANSFSHANFSIVERIGIVIFFALFAPFALWIAYLLSKLWKGIYQFAQFAAVGTLNSFIDIGVFNLETFLYGSSIIGTALFAVFKAISFLCATTNSFAWNKYWTFKATDKADAKQVSGFYGVAIIGWVVNVGVATLVKSIGPETKAWTNIVAPLGGIAVTFVWNYIGYKFWVFRKKA